MGKKGLDVGIINNLDLIMFESAFLTQLVKF